MRAGRRRWRIRWSRLVLVLVLLYALGLGIRQQVYLAQLRAEVRALELELAATRARRVELEEAVRRLRDPATVELEARRRLGLARPGEIQYVTVPGPDAGAAPAGGAAPGRGRVADEEGGRR